ncbi:MAG: hypothetical protein ACO3X2_09795, partial [Candidatus Nanopelagicales bacterium]
AAAAGVARAAAASVSRTGITRSAIVSTTAGWKNSEADCEDSQNRSSRHHHEQLLLRIGVETLEPGDVALRVIGIHRVLGAHGLHLRANRTERVRLDG